ncbi:hypothetical protein KVC06_05980 [Helicobacter pylori]|uniref:hypothetical protein n=1 Tax=Helicobacter pylori TaxID=210 RepID=UPI0027121A80|nr:hypothetical protein [Helicobacter pylori]MDO7811616.1 hypothetical protein [Helicobacter pylori]WQU18668.1 hypothetical protein KVC06_05980 [Helicobacter pylori]
MKKLDFSGGFLSVISGNVILKYPLRVLQPKLKRSHLKYPLEEFYNQIQNDLTKQPNPHFTATPINKF